MRRLWGRLKSWEGEAWSRRFWLIWLAIGVMGVTVGVFLYWSIRPYDNFSYGAVGPVKTDERTSDDVPVVRTGGNVRWDQQYCNHGANPTTSRRWADIYGTASAAGFVQQDFDEDDLVASFAIPDIVFWGEQDQCETTEVFAKLPLYVTPGAFYRLRVETRYRANPIRYPVSVAETEVFLLLAPGAPIQ